jgi:hypothetical protein
MDACPQSSGHRGLAEEHAAGGGALDAYLFPGVDRTAGRRGSTPTES